MLRNRPLPIACYRFSQPLEKKGWHNEPILRPIWSLL